jgi:hypothetical protein
VKLTQVFLNKSQCQPDQIFTAVVETIIQSCDFISMFAFDIIESIKAIIFI